jgi:hypothetical protein
MRNLYNQWMDEAIKEYTPSGKIKRPSYSLVANWVKESWDSIDIDMIKRSFKCCGVSNATDGSEDNLIFDLTKVKDVNNPGRGIEEDNEDNGNDNDNSECESEEDYYEQNEELNVIQDWNNFD